jgi:NDP-sugar pyrophosphorylase family protein
MNVLILMAGDGKRFTDAGINTPKPLIEVNGKPILEWTTRSLPFIKHIDEDHSMSIAPENLYFAIRQEHENDGVCDYLKRVYGDDINFIVFQKTTRGNMETAYVSTLSMPSEEPLLILDADNKYNDCDFLDTLSEAVDFDNSMVVTYFDPVDADPKWAFVFTDGALVTRIVEKDPTALEQGGCPLVGTFWFKTTSLFQRYADALIQTNTRSGTPGREEFYVSQVPSTHVKNGGIVFAHKVNEVVPLGTPDDVEKFKL